MVCFTLRFTFIPEQKLIIVRNRKAVLISYLGKRSPGKRQMLLKMIVMEQGTLLSVCHFANNSSGTAKRSHAVVSIVLVTLQCQSAGTGVCCF